MGKGNEKPEAGGEKKGPAKFKEQFLKNFTNN
jgi:hypothetical protein